MNTRAIALTLLAFGSMVVASACSVDAGISGPPVGEVVVCTDEGGDCTSDAECCSDACASDNTCGGPNNCTLDNDPCSLDADCCSNLCASDGFCGLP